jgi:hypothetical protein
VIPTSCELPFTVLLAAMPVSAVRECSAAEPAILERRRHGTSNLNGKIMNQIVYIVGAIVIVVALLGFIGIR